MSIKAKVIAVGSEDMENHVTLDMGSIEGLRLMAKSLYLPVEIHTMADDGDEISIVEKYKDVIRLAYGWSKSPEHWMQARDVLRNQMHEMGEL